MSSSLPPHAIKKLLDLGAALKDEGVESELEIVDLGKYEIKEEIGRGGMGIVYEAWDRELGRRVALKTLTQTAGMSEGMRVRFVREAKAVAKLSHPHVAAVYDATSEYIAMQLVEGESLATYEGKDPQAIIRLIRDAAHAIHYAHQQGIVHRDLKPANLMVEGREGSGEPHIYVMDFGLAKETALESFLSLSGNLLGTPAYMSPEQAAGRASEVDARSDIYALGVTMYQCLSKQLPFSGDDVYQVMKQVVEDDPPGLRTSAPSIDRDLHTIVMKCLEKDPDRRYSSASALADDLGRWLRGEAIVARPPSLGYKVGKFISRRKSVLKAGGIAAAVVATLILLIVLPMSAREAAKRETAERALRLASLVENVLDQAEESLSAINPARAAERLDEGIRACREFLENAEAGYVHYFLGRLYLLKGEPAVALKELNRALELDPALSEAAFERGLLRAFRYFEELVIANALESSALADLRLRAMADLSVPLDRYMKPSELGLGRAQLEWLEGDPVAAIRSLNDLLEEDRTYYPGHLALSRMYILNDEPDKALQSALIVSDLLNRFRTEYETRDLPERLAAGTSAAPRTIELDHVQLMLVDHTLGTVELRAEVLARLRRAQRDVETAVRLFRAQDFSTSLEVWKRALEGYTTAAQLQPNDGGIENNLGVCLLALDALYTHLGDYTKAQEQRNAARLSFLFAASQDFAHASFNLAEGSRRTANQLRLGLRTADARVFFDMAASEYEQALVDAPEGWPERPRIEERLKQIPE